MDPYLRPAPPENGPAQPCPPDHVAEPAGQWSLGPMEVVYDPDEHDVCFVRGSIGDDVSNRLRQAGWEQTWIGGSNEMWVRDRALAAEQALAQITRTNPSRGLGR